MRVCPKCGHNDPPYWRPARHSNPDGTTDICHINDLEFHEPNLAEKLKHNRGVVVQDETFAYYLGKRAVHVKRVWKKLVEWGGKSAFNIPYEHTRKHADPFQTTFPQPVK